MFPSRSALIVSLQKLNESNNYEPIIVTLKWFCFNSGYLGIIRHWCTSSHSAIIIFTFSNYYLHIQHLLSSHSAIIIFTFSNYYLHIQQLLSSQSVIIIFTFSILFSSFIRNSYACPLYNVWVLYIIWCKIIYFCNA